MSKPPDIVTPCCKVRPIFIIAPGSGYTQPDYLEEIICSAEDCSNSWSAKGEANGWNK